VSKKIQKIKPGPTRTSGNVKIIEIVINNFPKRIPGPPNASRPWVSDQPHCHHYQMIECPVSNTSPDLPQNYVPPRKEKVEKEREQMRSSKSELRSLEEYPA
jgi:hypothetical protein